MEDGAKALVRHRCGEFGGSVSRSSRVKLNLIGIGPRFHSPATTTFAAVTTQGLGNDFETCRNMTIGLCIYGSKRT
jgi:hypothetical protein